MHPADEAEAHLAPPEPAHMAMHDDHVGGGSGSSLFDAALDAGARRRAVLETEQLERARQAAEQMLRRQGPEPPALLRRERSPGLVWGSEDKEEEWERERETAAARVRAQVGAGPTLLANAYVVMGDACVVISTANWRRFGALTHS